VIFLVLVWISCKKHPGQVGVDIPPIDSVNTANVFPAFYTPIEKFFSVKIADAPIIDGKNYELNIHGAINTPRKYSLAELYKLELIDVTLTLECIHNSNSGNLVGTVIWKGFRLYDLLSSLGINKDATNVKFTCKDGYYSCSSLSELKENGIIGALFMNGLPLPTNFGFPLKIINPGFYGVKNPGWVIDIEVLTKDSKDYWEILGWDTNKQTDVKSKVFFPANGAIFSKGGKIKIGGCAYGCKHVSKVELSSTNGYFWEEAKIVKSADDEYVWSFWESTVFFEKPGNYTIYVRAFDQDNTVQPFSDSFPWDGTNYWPEITLMVK